MPELSKLTDLIATVSYLKVTKTCNVVDFLTYQMNDKMDQDVKRFL